MRKITQGLLSFLLFLAAASAFSAAPKLRELPEIIIGDIEFGDSNNLFIFQDAFIFDKYVSDTDTTCTWPYMKWSYNNFPGNTQLVKINDIDAEPGVDYNNPVNPINAGGQTTASFRNESLSPSSGTTPYPTPASLSNVYLRVYVSDGTSVVSRPITVYTVDDGQDSWGECIYSSIQKESFNTLNNWQFVSGITGAPAPPEFGGSYPPGRLNLTWPTTGFPATGYYLWAQYNSSGTGLNDTIPYVKDNLCVMKVKIYADKDTAVPGFRLRAQSLDNVWTVCTVFGADGAYPDQGGAPGKTTQDFYTVFQPQGSVSYAFLAIDMFAANQNSGSVFVDEFEIYTIDPSLILLSDSKFIDNFSSWESINNAEINNDYISLLPPEDYLFNSAGDFVILNQPVNKSELYRISYFLSKNSNDYKANQFRLRVADTRNGAYSSNFVFDDKNPEARINLTTTPQQFYLWHYTMNSRSVSPEGDLTVLIDSIKSNEDPAASIILNSVDISKDMTDIISSLH